MKLLKFVYDFIFPVFSVWFIVGFIRLCNYLHTQKLLHTVLVVICFPLVIFFELVFTKVFYKSKKFLPEKFVQKLGLFFRIIFWLVLFFMWAVVMPLFEEDRLWLE
ncbi:MAG: hypothetical protein N2Z73_01875, partial [Endomicrobia bacterium]|nr:hypothetical protein [Endomicrobiia bacterium]